GRISGSSRPTKGSLSASPSRPTAKRWPRPPRRRASPSRSGTWTPRWRTERRRSPDLRLRFKERRNHAAATSVPHRVVGSPHVRRWVSRSRGDRADPERFRSVRAAYDRAHGRPGAGGGDRQSAGGALGEAEGYPRTAFG